MTYRDLTIQFALRLCSRLDESQNPDEGPDFVYEPQDVWRLAAGMAQSCPMVLDDDPEDIAKLLAKFGDYGLLQKRHESCVTDNWDGIKRESTRVAQDEFYRAAERRRKRDRMQKALRRFLREAVYPLNEEQLALGSNRIAHDRKSRKCARPRDEADCELCQEALGWLREANLLRPEKSVQAGA